MLVYLEFDYSQVLETDRVGSFGTSFRGLGASDPKRSELNYLGWDQITQFSTKKNSSGFNGLNDFTVNIISLTKETSFCVRITHHTSNSAIHTYTSSCCLHKYLIDYKTYAGLATDNVNPTIPNFWHLWFCTRYIH